jgi:hypothetical protein
MCPRSRFQSARKRPEFSKIGVYVLTGPRLEDEQRTIYVGEGDPVRPRIDKHNIDKDFWTSVVAFTSKDLNLNKAHVQYLESKLITLARETKRCALDNANSPNLPSISEADAADMDTFLEQMRLVFPILGIMAFEKPQTQSADQSTLYLEQRGAHGRGHEASQGFIVHAGSTARTDTVDSIPTHVVDLRKELVQQGVLKPSSDHYQVTQDFTFSSPSAAAAVLVGGSCNGRTAWKDENGTTLKSLQEQASEEPVDP